MHTPRGVQKGWMDCEDPMKSANLVSHCCPAWCVLLPLTRAVLVVRSGAGSVALPGELRSLGQWFRTWKDP